MLVEFQQAMADLVSDPALCRTVRANPAVLPRRYTLTEAETARLLGMVQHDGMTAACMVYRMNRLSPLVMNLRDTLHALGPQLQDTLSAYWRLHPRGHPHFHLESERFCQFVQTLLADDGAALPALMTALQRDAAAVAAALEASRH